MSKIGRNDPCPCGSGKKYKRCHLLSQAQDPVTDGQHKIMLARADALRVQRERQQGLGRPIISTESLGERFVAVKNRLLHSKKWKTFHDFLFDYIKVAMGEDWGNAEIAKPRGQRHPILIWYQLYCKHQKDFVKVPGKVHSAQMIGADAAYLNLAYDLYALDHNAELQEKLICRLRDPDNFHGARYEVFAAATLIRAGFEIEFENEDDRTTSHCEFTATFTRTGKRFSVEAKRRDSNKSRFGRLLIRALSKRANHTRIVFLDINTPDNTTGTDVPTWLTSALRRLRAFEGRIVNNESLPEAYLFLTNSPWHHHLKIQSSRCAVMAEGFQIPDFKVDVGLPLREAIEARERHTEMYDLLQSMQDHRDIPSTFDGEIPEFAFDNDVARLLIGQRYLAKDGNGRDQEGILTTATVIENEQKAYCGFLLDDNQHVLNTIPLSDVEMSAWRKHPDTFFGEVGQRKQRADSPLELYDFFLESHQDTPRDRLLEWMARAPNIEELRKLPQPALASVYAEGCVNSAMASQSRMGQPNNLE